MEFPAKSARPTERGEKLVIGRSGGLAPWRRWLLPRH